MTQFGYNTIGSNGQGQVGGAVTYFRFIPSASLIGRRIFLYAFASSGTAHVTLGIYADSAGAPGTKLATSPEITFGTTPAWHSATLSAGIPLAAGASYWIAISAADDINLFYDTGTYASDFSSFTYVAGSLPASSPSIAAWNSTFLFSVYCDDGGAITGLSFTDAAGNAIASLPSNHGSGSVNIKVVASSATFSSGASWSASGVSGWSVSSSTFVDSQHYNLTLGCPAAASPPVGSAGILTISDTTDSASASLGINTPVLSLSPMIADVGATPTISLSCPDSLWANETAAGLFAESGGTGAGIGTPTVSSNGLATATLTAGSAGATLTITDASTGAQASILAASVISVGGSNFFVSPYNWHSDGSGTMQATNVLPGSTTATCNNPGGYIKLACNVTTISDIVLYLDTRNLSGIAVGSCPAIWWSVDGGAFSTSTLSHSSDATSITLKASASVGLHNLLVVFQINDITIDRWTTPVDSVSVLGVGFTGTLSSPVLLGKNMLVYGDSISEGWIAGAGGATDATSAYWNALGWALGAEVGAIGWSSQGWTANGLGGVPQFYRTGNLNQTWDKYSLGRSRLVGGLFVPDPDYIFVVHGQNDSSDTTVATDLAAWLAEARVAAPSAWIFAVIPFSQKVATGITNGFNNYQSSTPDSKCKLLDLGPQFASYVVSSGLFSSEGTHENTRGHAVASAMLAEKAQAQIGGSAGGGGMLLPRGFSGGFAA